MSWADHGYPIIRNDDVDELIELLRRWYVDYRQGAGGLLHVWADDGNLSDNHINSDYLDQQVAELPAYLARNREEGYGPAAEHTDEKIRADMLRIIELWRSMTEPERESANAWHDGTAQRYLAELQNEPTVDAFDVDSRQPSWSTATVQEGPYGSWMGTKAVSFTVREATCFVFNVRSKKTEIRRAEDGTHHVTIVGVDGEDYGVELTCQLTPFLLAETVISYVDDLPDLKFELTLTGRIQPADGKNWSTRVVEDPLFSREKWSPPNG